MSDSLTLGLLIPGFLVRGYVVFLIPVAMHICGGRRRAPFWAASQNLLCRSVWYSSAIDNSRSFRYSKRKTWKIERQLLQRQVANLISPLPFVFRVFFVIRVNSFICSLHPTTRAHSPAALSISSDGSSTWLISSSFRHLGMQQCRAAVCPLVLSSLHVSFT